MARVRLPLRIQGHHRRRTCEATRHLRRRPARSMPRRARATSVRLCGCRCHSLLSSLKLVECPLVLSGAEFSIGTPRFTASQAYLKGHAAVLTYRKTRRRLPRHALFDHAEALVEALYHAEQVWPRRRFLH